MDNKQIEKLQEKFYHWFIGDNNIRSDKPSYIANIDIGIIIRFDDSISFNADFNEFFNGLADVQFFNGNRPSEDEVIRILTDAYNYMVIEDKILEQDLADIDINEDIW